MNKYLIGGSIALAALPVLAWGVGVRIGQTFAVRDHLQPADAIVVLAGTRGNIEFLNGKIRTAVDLYQRGWATHLLFTGGFSAKVTNTPCLYPVEQLQAAVQQGRIQEKDVAVAAKTWDRNLGASYMADRAAALGVPASALLIEDSSLHTRENAEQVFSLLRHHQFHRIILVTSPFHQLRTFLTFAKVFQEQGDGIEIINYYAQTGEWHPLTWFLSAQCRKLVASERQRIATYRAKGDLL